MFLTPCYNNFIYVYKYACLVKLKYLEYLVNWTCTRPYFKSIPQPFAIAVRAGHRRPPRLQELGSLPRGARCRSGVECYLATVASHAAGFLGEDHQYYKKRDRYESSTSRDFTRAAASCHVAHVHHSL